MSELKLVTRRTNTAEEIKNRLLKISARISWGPERIKIQKELAKEKRTRISV